MPFVLRNVSVTFQRAFDTILFAVLLQRSLVFIYEDVIFSEDYLQRAMIIDEMLLLLSQTEVPSKLPKFCFFQKQVEHSSHVLLQD